jgi:ABC-type Fe3+/spermidine/putrescine transport system ATPase subunit
MLPAKGKNGAPGGALSGPTGLPAGVAAVRRGHPAVASNPRAKGPPISANPVGATPAPGRLSTHPRPPTPPHSRHLGHINNHVLVRLAPPKDSASRTMHTIMLSVRDLVKHYTTAIGPVEALNGVSFDIPAGHVTALLGPSGCGKTTILRCVAGLEEPDSGEVDINGTPVFARARRVNVPTAARPIAMVFQSYAIWPHMTVFENVAYPLRVGKAKLSKHQLHDEVLQTLEIVRIPELAARAATSLSGGQQQRVALARALVRKPKLLLLDEPLSNLDAKLRDEMRLELKDLFSHTDITVLYVTHDLLEALVLSDKIVVIEAGSVVQEGTPLQVYSLPQNRFVADSLNTSGLLQQELQRLTSSNS